MVNNWDNQNIPHKGWILQDVEDIREEGQSESDTDYETCMMCRKEKIRFVHIVTHLDVQEIFRVGCVCASRMTNDYVNPKRREQDLENLANRKKTWNKKKWKISTGNNPILYVNGCRLIIIKDYKTNKYKLIVGDKLGELVYDNIENAKNRAFEVIEHRKKKRAKLKIKEV